MSNFEIVRYTPDKAAEWNQFVAKSKNGTFLFDRGYMDYHADRFCDHSLMFYKKGHLYALLPAEKKSNVLTSHGGLTYGGLVMGNEATTKHVVELFAQMKEHLQEAGIDRVVYKAIPAIYHRLPAEEDLYAIHSTCRYRLLERDVSSAIIPAAPIAWKKDRRHGLKKALQSGLRVSEQPDYERFWEILTDNLREKYGATPVHSLSEILLLRNRFPKNIRLFTALRNNELLGGCVVYVANSRVAHSQYISATDEGKRLGAIDLIVSHLLENVFPQISFFDFGKSTEQHSDRLNENLIYQKEGFGGRAICYDTYEWEVNSE